jgi:acetyl esterase/lipase
MKKRYVFLCIEILLLTALLSGCQSHRFKLKDIPYGPYPVQTMDVYPAFTNPSTFIIVIHGGGFVYGDKKDFSEHASWFASLGYPTACINYRLMPDGRYPKGVDDVLLAMKLLTEKYGAKQFILFGHSAGAYLALLVTLAKNNPHSFGVEANYSAPIIAAIGTSGPYDYHLLTGKALQEYTDFAGGSLDDANVVPYADSNDPPVLVLAGGQDIFVSPQCSQELHDHLPNSVYYLIEDADHNGIIKPFDTTKPAFGYIEDFLSTLSR